ncbi:formate C-acetyltransferase [Bacillus sp. HMF5848]|uniref:formate C-acetyltransferase n=1 Tax=Bacillus sp. HMF5848 TaxID=2495421 RepID=UPI000F7B624D|nr:formate C-acetyltransferase [Bacillus sp. HMF5848]RSK25884.1 formate C-acetyltransferase [Bacillus sp. HMF5848]
MNERIRHLKQDLFKRDRKVSIERALLYTESYQQTKGEPTIIRRAKATENILNKVKISIRDKELIVGNRTVEPRSGIISPEMDPYWILAELDTIHSRPQDKFVISEEDKQIYRDTLYPYWEKNSMKDFINAQISPKVKEAVNQDVFKLNQTDKGQGHIIMDFPFILNQGVQSIIDIIDGKVGSHPDNLYYEAAKITFKATQQHILRYADLARVEAEMYEDDHERKNELLEIERICRKITYSKPDSFYEASQLLWFISLVGQYESNASSLSLGRIDQYMYPFYEYSLKNGDSQEYLKELLECFFIKTNDVVLIRSENSAKYFAGFPTGYTVALGGLTETGRDAVNDLSYLFFEAYHDVQLPQPNLSVRTNELIPRAFLNKTAETIRLGTGIPQLFNDEVIVPGFLSKGVTLEDARDYAIVGCVEITIPGKTYGLHDIALFNLLKIMELSILEHKDNSHVTYETIIEDIQAKIKHYVELVTEGANIVDIGHREFAPTPFLSTLIDSCLEKGKDVTEGGAKYNFSGIQGIGQANLSDSLYAIKKLVFEEKRIEFKELVEALENDFGTEEQERLRVRLINRYDKYGNDNDEIDDIAASLFRVYAKELEKYTNVRGGVFTAGAYTVSAHIPLGEAVGATPDGRKAKEQLADGGLSPMVGRDKLGPTAVLKSVSKLDNYLTVNGSLLNLKFSPSSIEGEEGINKFSDFLMAFTKLKIQHVQFNVLTKETLIDAQKHPQNYKGLIVRVAGYSAFFVELDRKLQNDIIARVEHSL